MMVPTQMGRHRGISLILFGGETLITKQIFIEPPFATICKCENDIKNVKL
jgi:hypothetical protein